MLTSIHQNCTFMLNQNCCFLLQTGCGLFSKLPDPKNKKASKATTTISMVPRSTMRNISIIEEKAKPRKTDIKCFEPKPVEAAEEEEADEDDQDDSDFLGLSKINEMPDVAPVAGFDLPDIKSTTPLAIDDDKVYGPVYCPDAGASDVYEDGETKLTLDANAVRLFRLIYKQTEYALFIYQFFFFTAETT